MLSLLVAIFATIFATFLATDLGGKLLQLHGPPPRCLLPVAYPRCIPMPTLLFLRCIVLDASSHMPLTRCLLPHNKKLCSGFRAGVILLIEHAGTWQLLPRALLVVPAISPMAHARHEEHGRFSHELCSWCQRSCTWLMQGYIYNKFGNRGKSKLNILTILGSLENAVARLNK